MTTMSTKIPEKLRKRVEKLSHINWSEVMRLSIIKKVEEEEEKMMYRDRKSIEKSLQKMKQLRRKAQGNTTEELRTWREVKH
ncbi:MAG: hypothetical protein ACW964_13615 [Candidatus Hodarchaeales archaeon]